MGRTQKRLVVAAAAIVFVAALLVIAGVVGGRYAVPPYISLVPRNMVLDPATAEACQRLYALDLLGKKRSYSRAEFQQLLTFAYYPDRTSTDFMVNAGALGSMFLAELPQGDPGLYHFERREMVRAAALFLDHPQPSVRWSAARIITVHRLCEATPELAAALRRETNPTVAGEMRAALSSCPS